MGILPRPDGPLLQLPLSEVMRTEIARELQQALRFFTVGDFLSGWYDPRRRRLIEQAFEQPGQAQQAAATCAAWMGVPAPADRWGVPAWWRQEPNEPALPDPSASHPARAAAGGESQALLGKV